MPLYRIGLTQKVYEEATLQIEAATPYLAEKAALEKVYAGNVEWRFLECCEDAQIISNEVIHT